MGRTAKTAAPPHLKGLIFDLDGTLLLSDRSLGSYEILPGAAELLTELARRSVPFVVLTNGSAYPPAEQAAKLRRVGLPVRDECMLTPSSVAADLMVRAGVRRALVLGSSGVGQALRDARIETLQVGERGERDVQAVYVGWYPECTMKAIEAACHAIWTGARLYVASDVPFFATKQGRTMGYSYAIVGAIRRVTRAPMILTGKPSLHALRFVARRLGLRRSRLRDRRRRPIGGDHHGATRRREGLCRDDGRYRTRGVGASDRPAAPRAGAAAPRRSS